MITLSIILTVVIVTSFFIDDKGVFYADDQIGFFFKEVQKIQEALNEFTLK